MVKKVLVLQYHMESLEKESGYINNDDLTLNTKQDIVIIMQAGQAGQTWKPTADQTVKPSPTTPAK